MCFTQSANRAVKCCGSWSSRRTASRPWWNILFNAARLFPAKNVADFAHNQNLNLFLAAISARRIFWRDAWVPLCCSKKRGFAICSLKNSPFFLNTDQVRQRGVGSESQGHAERCGHLFGLLHPEDRFRKGESPFHFSLPRATLRRNFAYLHIQQQLKRKSSLLSLKAKKGFGTYPLPLARRFLSRALFFLGTCCVLRGLLGTPGWAPLSFLFGRRWGWSRAKKCSGEF